MQSKEKCEISHVFSVNSTSASCAVCSINAFSSKKLLKALNATLIKAKILIFAFFPDTQISLSANQQKKRHHETTCLRKTTDNLATVQDKYFSVDFAWDD